MFAWLPECAGLRIGTVTRAGWDTCHRLYDVVEKPRRIQISGFMNIYEAPTGSFEAGEVHLSKLEADDQTVGSGWPRVACVPVNIDCAEGDGL